MEKIKIRISSFVLLILENDAQRFGFIKSDDTPNRNGLINKLIPNLLQVRKSRREEIRRLLSHMGNARAEEIYEAVDHVIDEVYFNDADLDTLNTEIWILPTKQAETAFEEIYESELSITALTVTEYLRGLLNEYALLPQYKREAFAFYEELILIETACGSGSLLHFEFEEEKYKFFPFEHMYGFLYDQTNYLIGYDIIRKEIRAFPVAAIKKLYVLKRTFRPSDDLIGRLQEYLDEYNYDKENIIRLGENYEAEK